MPVDGAWAHQYDLPVEYYHRSRAREEQGAKASNENMIMRHANRLPLCSATAATHAVTHRDMIPVDTCMVVSNRGIHIQCSLT